MYSIFLLHNIFSLLSYVHKLRIRGMELLTFAYGFVSAHRIALETGSMFVDIIYSFSSDIVAQTYTSSGDFMLYQLFRIETVSGWQC
jgi:hypothetical protein